MFLIFNLQVRKIINCNYFYHYLNLNFALIFSLILLEIASAIKSCEFFNFGTIIEMLKIS